MKRVLVVDDTKNIRNLLTTCLEAEGYQVSSAADGLVALEMLIQESVDLAFLDIKLPELSGTEVLRQIRERGIQTPVIIMTAFATIKNAVECTKLGAVAYLQKPFTAERVRQVLRELAGQDMEETVTGELGQIEELIAGNRLPEAYLKLKHALSLEPNRGEIYHLLARVYEAQGNQEEARRFKAIAAQFDT